MKPSIFHRFLLVVLTLLGMVVGLLLLVMATGLYPLDTLRMGIDAYRTQLGTLNFALVMGGTGVVLFLLFLAILVGFNRGDRTPTQPPVTSALVSAGDYGTTQIALSAIDAMVQRHCKTNVRIREVASVITLQGKRHWHSAQAVPAQRRQHSRNHRGPAQLFAGAYRDPYGDPGAGSEHYGG